MNKKIFLTIGILLVSLTISAKDFHFVYLRIDDSMDIELVKERIRDLTSEFENKDFVLYYSNHKATMDAENFSEKELLGLINEQMSSSAITLSNEVADIAEVLEKYLQAEFDENNRLVSPKYSQITLNCIVGDNFVENKYQDEVFARSIVVNSLSDFPLQINFYCCGARYSDVKFSNQYKLSKEINIKSI
ncbi:MAG: hypothetical protein LBJ17_07445 [Dysgonamonadaceae bacterium]|jgi:hypothetical protein|nr:hypothetical protein [Dysgonamonadaceae bacterium]